VELFFARLLFALTRATGNRHSAIAKFAAERVKIRAMVKTCDAANAARRVLIRRPVGLEDSSRNWSVWMTLDHLRIVHERMTAVIAALLNGHIPPGAASTAAVKPEAGVDERAFPAWEASCDALLAVMTLPADFKTEARFPHPWFGPLNAAGWVALAATHHAIHRVQIERILAGLHR
jgi:hypothetical protein